MEELLHVRCYIAYHKPNCKQTRADAQNGLDSTFKKVECQGDTLRAYIIEVNLSFVEVLLMIAERAYKI